MAPTVPVRGVATDRSGIVHPWRRFVSRRLSPLDELDDVATVFDALAHSARRQILLVLLARGESMTSKEVAEWFSTTWATVSRHLKTLESAGLIRVGHGDDGRVRVYQLDRARLTDVVGTWIGHFDDDEFVRFEGPPRSSSRPAERCSPAINRE